MKFRFTGFLLFLLLLPVLFSSCSRKLVNTRSLVIYPAPPDTTRIQYLTSFTSAVDISGKRSALKSTVLGDETPLSLRKPYGIASSPGKLYICDAGTGGLAIIDLAKKKFTPFVPGGKGKLRMPVNCCTDEDGRLYVADGERGDVVVFDKDLNYLASLGNPYPSREFRPLDVCVTADKVWVTNSKGASICSYNKSDFSFSGSFPDTLPAEVRLFYNPINITAGAGKIYVTDFGDFKIKVLDEAGQFLYSIGQYGKAPGQFVRPKGIAVDQDQLLYVVDAGFENVQLFNEQGKLLMYFGGPYKAPGDMWLPAKVYIDYKNREYYKKWVSKEYELSYLIFVSNQYGPDKISVYGAVKPVAVK
ncbi:MAG: 6-bladed beta-propeller [Sphingobacteriales bacterium]|nr:6-bladed beta-propeller [Sphingobacteriales bacterium]